MALLYVSISGHTECVSPLSSDSLVSNGTHLPTNGVIMLFPELKFNCTSGYVSSVKMIAFLEELGFVSRYFEFQIWRPTSLNNYQLVTADFINDESLNETFSNTVKSYFKTYTNQQQKSLYFQRNDIIGMYIPPQGNTAAPIVPTFLNVTERDNGMRLTTTKLYWTSIPFAPCNVSLCSSSFNVINNAILQTKIEGI